MRNLIVYDLEVVGGNFFIATFLNVKTNKKFTCYKIDDKDVRTDIIEMLISNSLFIGVGNSKHNDIILNYIFHQAKINTKELYTLSMTIKECNKLAIPLWSHTDIGFYVDKYISSLDLIKIASIVNLKTPDKVALPMEYNQHIQEEDIDIIKSCTIDNVDNSNDLLLDIKERLNYGFKKSNNHLTTAESIYKTYITQMLQLNRNEEIYKEMEE